MKDTILFPNLGLELPGIGDHISIFGYEIAFYGLIIALGMLVASLTVLHLVKKHGESTDGYIDLIFWGIIFGIIGARIYYVVFSWDIYKNDLIGIFQIRNGGLAIYGGIIGAMLAVWLAGKRKKLQFGHIMDYGCIGIVIGQIFGRWGNFFNREAFGGYTDSLLAMALPTSRLRENEISAAMLEHAFDKGGELWVKVHPTFLYESLWNLLVLIILLWFFNKKRWDGQVLTLYLISYGLGRVWIEGLRTDQLLLPGIGWPVSQVLAAVTVIVGVIFWILYGRKAKTRPE
ncbi:MAG: prolipoprotein diacylglyceryl transferase [Lachnospiraceae bacterium]|nr:prolipoprotein diacylglyceryl transferase [Lachnospiraceae bacterium]MDY5742733.1 prolipoprotein diacylglyceryl transferase [Lachnospiraceae bacterium]